MRKKGKEGASSEKQAPSKLYITGKPGIILSIGAIIPVIICGYIAIRFIWPGAGRIENLVAAVFTILSLCFLAITLVREVVVNVHLIGERERYPSDLVLTEIAKRISRQAAGLEEAAAVWHDTYRDLLASKGYIENIVNAIGECLIAVNLNGIITWVNNGTNQLLGYERDELISKLFVDILQESGRRVFADSDRVKEGGVLKEYDTAFIAKSNERIPVSLSASPLSDSEGDVIGMIAVATDLREKKALIRELQQAKSELEKRVVERTRELAEVKDSRENIIRSMTDMLIVVDEKGVIKEMNEAGEKLLGYSKEELAGEKTDKVISRSSDENADEVRFISKTGEEIPVSIKRSELYDKEGKKVGGLIIARDIRERLATEMKMREASRMSALGQFAAGAAHEINNPLSVISSNTQYLIEKLWDAEKNDGKLAKEDLSELIQSLDLIRRYSLSCSSTIQRLLDFARGASELSQKKTVDINRVLSDTVDFLEPQFKLSGINLIRKFSEGNFTTIGDFVRLQQVFMNVLLNASESTDKGGTITVSTLPELLSSGTRSVRIDITDGGCGISSENIPRVFDPFFTTKKPGTGIGLGLSVVYSIVKEHGGTITIESEQGKGTTVTIMLPCHE